MKKLFSTLAVGLIFLYLIDSAFKIDGLTGEMLIDNSMRFLLGFIGMGMWHWPKLKIYMYVVLFFLISDVIFDYIEDISTLDLAMTIHDLFIFFWGALSGHFFIEYSHSKRLIGEEGEV